MSPCVLPKDPWQKRRVMNQKDNGKRGLVSSNSMRLFRNLAFFPLESLCLCNMSDTDQGYVLWSLRGTSHQALHLSLEIVAQPPCARVLDTSGATRHYDWAV